MKLKVPDKYTTTALLLLATAIILVAIALNSDPEDITTASFVFSGMICAMTGIFTLIG